MSDGISPAEVEAMTKALDKVREDWRKRPGVTALDVGFKMKNGRPTETLAIRVHVRRKLPTETLSAQEVFPDSLGPYDVDVVEADYSPQGEPNRKG